MNLRDLLIAQALNPKEVIVLRHRPSEPKLRKVLPWIAAERPDLFNAYQQCQGPGLGSAMGRARYAASFIGAEPGRALFVGIYETGEHRTLAGDEFWAMPEHQELRTLGLEAKLLNEPAARLHWRRLTLTSHYANWAGKLVVGWPPPERSWWRWASGKSNFPVVAIHEESALATRRPEWRSVNLSWEQLAMLPLTWRSALAEWRGIYLIFDTSDGKCYVGSAYGEQNILGRWQSYATTGHGGNRQLRKRDAGNFRFTILERVSPDMPADDVIALETSWKERLHSRLPHGLNDN